MLEAISFGYWSTKVYAGASNNTKSRSSLVNEPGSRHCINSVENL